MQDAVNSNGCLKWNMQIFVFLEEEEGGGAAVERPVQVSGSGLKLFQSGFFRTVLPQ